MNEVEEIYLPLSRLLSLYVAATHGCSAQRQFLGIRGTQGALHHRRRGLGRGRQIDDRARAAGAAGALVAAPKVDLVTTDGFLFPNAVLERRA